MFGIDRSKGIEITARILYMLVKGTYYPPEIVKELRKYKGIEREYAMFSYGYWVGMLYTDEYYETAHGLINTLKTMLEFKDTMDELKDVSEYELVRRYLEKIFAQSGEVPVSFDTVDYVR